MVLSVLISPKLLLFNDMALNNKQKISPSQSQINSKWKQSQGKMLCKGKVIFPFLFYLLGKRSTCWSLFRLLPSYDFYLLFFFKLSLVTLETEDSWPGFHNLRITPLRSVSELPLWHCPLSCNKYPDECILFKICEVLERIWLNCVN